MDPRDEEFWTESGAKTARNATAWLDSANHLKRAADVLRRQWKEDLLERHGQMPSGPFPESVGGPMMLLAAFAIENLVKGLLIARNPGAVAGLADKPEQMVHGESARHLSLQLCADAGVGLGRKEEDAVRRLEIYLLWAGRYPIPKDARKLGERHTTPEPQLETAASFSELELDVIDGLFSRLSEEVHREAMALVAGELQRERDEQKERRAQLLDQLEGITPTTIDGARVFKVGIDQRDEPASAIVCANGCGTSFRLTPQAHAAICGCDILYWAEPYYDGALQQELLCVLSYPPD